MSFKTIFLTSFIAGALLLVYLTGHLNPSSLRGKKHDPDERAFLAMKAAGNRTLGFHSIRFINMPKRYDRSDAMALQAYLAGVDVEEYRGVTTDDFSELGMPPTSNLNFVKPGEKGATRAHANIWTEILQKKLPPVLILESDASWDVNLRPIVALFNKKFTKLLNQLHSKPLYSANASGPVDFHLPTSEVTNAPWWADDGNQRTKEQQQQQQLAGDGDVIEPDPDDPWHSEHWDTISFGQCFDSQKTPTSYLRYSDPFVPDLGKDYFGQRLGKERVVHHSGGVVCTTGYAITQRGAAKMLLRTAIDLDAPLDLIMQAMMGSGELTTYSMMPTIMAQWQYVPKIGMEHRGANSDIQGTNLEDQNVLSNPDDLSGWDEVKRSHSVWMPKMGHPDVAFTEMALQVAWKKIFSKEKDIQVELD
ncbi:hypothetical protein GQ53DRAFT_797307 [Thozetella sp. PMI_491]|nr:hypothetical protein GQ53DRAFT_797307 [Thozetella sp. PMI_491]